MGDRERSARRTHQPGARHPRRRKAAQPDVADPQRGDLLDLGDAIVGCASQREALDDFVGEMGAVSVGLLEAGTTKLATLHQVCGKIRAEALEDLWIRLG